MSGMNEDIPSEIQPPTLHYPTMSHVKRIVLDFESRRLLRAEFEGFHERHHRDLFSTERPAAAVARHSLPGAEGGVGGFYDQVPDHQMYRGGHGMPRHVEREMLKRQHSLVFECNWWLEGEQMQMNRKKPSFKKKVKKFFSSLMCSSNKNLD